MTEVRSKPNADSRAITLLHRRTEDRWPEVYLLRRSRERVKGHRWVKRRLPGRPTGARLGHRRRAAQAHAHPQGVGSSSACGSGAPRGKVLAAPASRIASS